MESTTKQSVPAGKRIELATEIILDGNVGLNAATIKDRAKQTIVLMALLLLLLPLVNYYLILIIWGSS